ncbi:MAG: ABC transporter permease [Clostridia bacterium]|nr:ABC transporter permease [Clostridia bacterium]
MFLNELWAALVSVWEALPGLWNLTIGGVWETLYITFASTAFAYILGIPLGIMLVVFRKDHLIPSPRTRSLLDVIVNILRSVPFLILMIAAIPLTRLVVGTSIGTTATIVPLVVASFPFVARTVESSLLEVDPGVIEAAQAMGANRFQIVCKVILREAVPGLVNGAALATTAILGYTAMAGAIGGGGLGAIAINYGYYRFRTDVLWFAIVELVLLVQGIQFVGTRVSRLLDHRQR